MDHFMEEVVVKKNRTMDTISYGAAWVLLVLLGLLTMMNLSAIMSAIAQGIPISQLLLDIVFTLVTGGCAVVLFLFKDRLRTEYEYTFTNGDLDFAQVFNNTKRKNLGTVSVKRVDAFGPVSGSSFQRYISMPNVNQSRWFLNRGANLYFLYFQKDQNKRIIVLEPSEELVAMIKHYLPHGAYQE